MRKLSKSDLFSISGGWADPEECKRIQNDAFDHEKDPDTTDKDWDDWGNDFDKYCLGI